MPFPVCGNSLPLTVAAIGSIPIHGDQVIKLQVLINFYNLITFLETCLHELNTSVLSSTERPASAGAE